MINWALCVPEACSAGDVEAALHATIAEFTAGTGLQVRARVEARMCQTAEPEKVYDRNTRLAIGFFVAVLVWTAISTVVDWTCSTPSKCLGFICDI